jgi:hypothetical protein
MAINLRDIRTAVTEYLETSVTMSVSPAVPDEPTVISPDEEFTYSITATNASGPAAIKLTDVVYAVSIEAANIAKLKVPASPPARASIDPSAPTLAPGSLVAAMFLFPSNDTLPVGDGDIVQGLKGKGLIPGPNKIKAFIHAKVDENFLFPTGKSATKTRSFSVL